MDKKAVVAYVGTYTYDGSDGLYVYDVKKDDCLMTLRESFGVKNPSYMVVSHDGQMLYSICDEGVCAFKIQDNGDLVYINTKPIGGMRGCYLTVDRERRYLFVAGYHDGHVAMMKLKKDGSISGIADSIFHTGHALSNTEQRLDHPKVSCVELTPDGEYLCASEYGLSQIRIYKIDYDLGKLRKVEVVRPGLDAGPRTIIFSKDGRFAYCLASHANKIETYRYTYGEEKPEFELVDRCAALKEYHGACGCTHMTMSHDGKHIFVSVDGPNWISWFERDEESGKLTFQNSLPISGDYPKFISLLPGKDEVVVLNHDTSEIRSFNMNYSGKYMLGCSKPAVLKAPNCIVFHEV